MQVLNILTKMGSVCSAGKAEKNKHDEMEVSVGKLNKLKSFVNRNGNCYSNSKVSTDRRKNQKKRNSGLFSREFKLVEDTTNLNITGKKQVIPSLLIDCTINLVVL